MVSELKKTQTMAEGNGDEKHELTSCRLIIYNTLTLQTHKTVMITYFGYFGCNGPRPICPHEEPLFFYDGV